MIEKEAQKDRILARTTTKITAYTQIISREEKMNPSGKFLTGKRTAGMIKERHPVEQERKIDTPKPKLNYCEAKPVSGSKRTLEGGMESPAKRSHSNVFKNLLEYWGGSAKDFSKQDFTYKNSYSCFKNATHRADDDEMDPDSDLVGRNSHYCCQSLIQTSVQFAHLYD